MSGKVLAGEEELTQPFQRHDKVSTDSSSRLVQISLDLAWRAVEPCS